MALSLLCPLGVLRLITLACLHILLRDKSIECYRHDRAHETTISVNLCYVHFDRLKLRDQGGRRRKRQSATSSLQPPYFSSTHMALIETHALHNNRNIHARKLSSSLPVPLCYVGQCESFSWAHVQAVILHNYTTVGWLWIQLYHGTNIKLRKSIDLSFCLKSSLCKMSCKGWFHRAELSW